MKRIIVKCPKCDQRLRVTLQDDEPDLSVSLVHQEFKWPEKEWNELWGSFHKFMKSVFPPRKA